MPKSKKPRKKGRHGRENAARKKWESGRFSSVEDARAAYRALEAARLKRKGGLSQIHFLLSLSDKEELVESFTRAFYALERWPTTKSYDDFNRVSSSLMLGILCHKRMAVEERDLLDDMQQAAFMAVVCVRLRNKGRPVPPQNLEAVRRGLTTAQHLMEFAYENDRQAFIDVLKHNDREHVENTPGLLEAHERLILGRNYEMVRRWEEEDGELEADPGALSRFDADQT